MSRLNWMIGSVAVACFAAGVGVGMAVPAFAATSEVDTPSSPEQQFVQGFVERFVERFDLDTDQVRDLRSILLQNYHEKVRIATTASLQQWPAELRSQLLKADSQMQRRLEWILDEEQRAQYRDEIREQIGK